MDISTEFYSPGYFPTSQAYEILYSCSHEIPPVKWKKSKSCCQRKHHFQWPPLRDWLNTRAILLMCHLWSSDSWNKGSPLFQLAVCKVILVSETRVHLCVWYRPFMDITQNLKLPRVANTNWISRQKRRADPPQNQQNAVARLKAHYQPCLWPWQQQPRCLARPPWWWPYGAPHRWRAVC